MPRSFRLNQEVMDRLQRIAEHLSKQTGMNCSQADVIRILSKEKEEQMLKEINPS